MYAMASLDFQVQHWFDFRFFFFFIQSEFSLSVNNNDDGDVDYCEPLQLCHTKYRPSKQRIAMLIDGAMRNSSRKSIASQHTHTNQ